MKIVIAPDSFKESLSAATTQPQNKEVFSLNLLQATYMLPIYHLLLSALEDRAIELVA